MHVRWDEAAAATPHGQLVFFAEFLAAAGVFERWVAACPLSYRSGNAPYKRDVLGTLHRLDRFAATSNAQAVISQREDQTDLLADIQCPTLVMGGRADPLFPPIEAEALARSIRGAQLHVLDDTAHLAPLEQPTRVLAALQEHLSAAW